MKQCYRCKVEKDNSEFRQNKANKDGLQPYCKPCQKDYSREYIKNRGPLTGERLERKRKADNQYYYDNHEAVREQQVDSRLRSRYGITLADYDNLLMAQDGKCAICKTTETGKHKRFQVDHNHTSGVVRGLLCGPCNRRLGAIENESWYAKAIEYLENYD